MGQENLIKKRGTKFQSLIFATIPPKWQKLVTCNDVDIR